MLCMFLVVVKQFSLNCVDVSIDLLVELVNARDMLLRTSQCCLPLAH